MRATCEAFLEGVPKRLADQPTREVKPSDALGLAWGKPAITLTCGVPAPSSLAAGATCIKVDGVSWFAPIEQSQDQHKDATLTLIDYTPRVELDIPAAYRPEGVAAALADLAAPVKAALRKTSGCS